MKYLNWGQSSLNQPESRKDEKVQFYLILLGNISWATFSFFLFFLALEERSLSVRSPASCVTVIPLKAKHHALPQLMLVALIPLSFSFSPVYRLTTTPARFKVAFCLSSIWRLFFEVLNVLLFTIERKCTEVPD